MAHSLTLIKSYLDGFFNLIYPNLCVCCGHSLMNQESVLCLKCNISIPRTNFHQLKDNPVEQVFWGRVPIEAAASFFHYFKGSQYKNILHQLKYKGRKDIGEVLGRMYGAELLNSDRFSEIDYIVPVPLHPRREKKRGYNQSFHIAVGLSQSLKVPIDSKCLYRKLYNDSQTTRGRFDRWENVNQLFELKDLHQFEGMHVLLVDDVVTTGATLEACAQALLQVHNIKLSIVTLAYASV